MRRRKPPAPARRPRKPPVTSAVERAAKAALWAAQWPEKVARGYYLDSQGYVARMERVGGRRRYVREHREVAERILGRPLVKGENCHHRNGDRTDNSEANIEVWSTVQPSGQRIEDKLAWAYQIIALYDPNGLQRPTR